MSTIDPLLKQRLQAFSFRKLSTNAAIVMKIDFANNVIIEDVDISQDVSQGTSLEELALELPPHEPRYVGYSYCYKHDDGRISFPFVFIFISPEGCAPEQQMTYAGSKNLVIQEGEFTQVFELRSTDEMTDAWLLSKLRYGL